MPHPNRGDLQRFSLSLARVVSDQDHWNTALEDMADLFGGSFATFELIDKRSGAHIQHIDCSDIDIQQDYIEHFVRKNPRIAFGNRPNSPEIMHDHLFMDEHRMDRDPFYADFLRSVDLRYFLAFKAFETSQMIGVFTVQKSARSGPVSDPDIRTLSGLKMLLQNVADAQVEYGELFSKSQTFDAFLETSRSGVVVLDNQGKLQRINSAAAKLARKKDGVTISGRQLKLLDDGANQKFENAIAHSEPDILGRSNVSVILAPRPSGLPPLKMTVQKVNHRNVNRAMGTPGTLVLIEDPVEKNAIEIDVLRDGFDFTEAEANVAAMLVRGRNASEIAEANHTSVATVRTQIQHIMQKLSVHRQIDVVRILTRYL